MTNEEGDVLVGGCATCGQDVEVTDINGNCKNCMETIKIYVGTYEKYNNGSIEGAWIDVTDLDKEEFYLKCKELHKEEVDPEFHFQDWECPDLLNDFISEGGTDTEFWELKELIKDFSDEQLEALTAYQSLFGTIDVQDFEDRYYGHFAGFFGDINSEFGQHILMKWDI
jgi:antirestriction protein